MSSGEDGGSSMGLVDGEENAKNELGMAICDI